MAKAAEVKKLNRKLMDFLDGSVNAFFAVENMKNILVEEGFLPLYEGEDWQLKRGGKYFVTRNGSALIAFVLPEKSFKGFQMMASHSDSPVFKIKGDPELEIDKAYIQLNVEKYGGMICSPWLDRPLSVAGRVLVKSVKGVETKLVNIDRDLLIIPNLAIHMNREVNDGYAASIFHYRRKGKFQEDCRGCDFRKRREHSGLGFISLQQTKGNDFGRKGRVHRKWKTG